MSHEFTLIYPAAAYILLALFSLAIGSLLNVIIYRLPLMIEAAWKAQSRNLLHIPAEKETSINLFLPRSFCPICKTTISAWYNIPILSYCLLKGRCIQCHTPISYRYLSVEILSLGLSLFAAWHFGFTLSLLFALLFIWILICLCFIDLEHQLLPDSLTLGLLWIGLVANTQGLFTTLPDAVISAACAYLSLWLFAQLFYLLTGKVGMGQGDFKLFAAFGAWFGWIQLPFILVFASFSGAIIGIIYLIATKQTKETPIPFAPFLCMAGLVSLFLGKVITQWYFS